MFNLKERQLERRIEELEKYRYWDRLDLQHFLALEDEEKRVAPEVPALEVFEEKLHIGDHWKGRDRYVWLAKEIHLPKEWAGKQVVGLFDFGKAGGGGNSGFESQCYVNKVMYQAVDSNHQELFFEDDWHGKPIYLAFRLWSGLEGGGKRIDQEHQLKQAELAVFDERTDDFYYTSFAILETIRILDENAAERVQLLSLLDHTIRLIDWSSPGSDAFYQSVYEANDHLQDRLDAMDSSSPVTIRCIGHTHIDVAWLWRLKHTREKAGRSFSTALRLMERYPDYKFLQTQPQLYSYVKQDFPELYAQIKERIAEGQWEVDGAMWLEADCNLPSGESLVRQILQGAKFIQEEFGKDVHYLWLPDVFGYSWALPQILTKAGINTFLTSKISWNQFNRMPNDTFTWRGLDGSEVLTQFITTPDPSPRENTWFATYNGQILPDTVTGTWDNYKNKALTKELLLSYGYGDGGGGVNRTMLEMRRRLDRIPGLPNVKTGDVKSYFESLHHQTRHTSEFMPVWDGELYLEYHRGTYTSQAYNKKMNRKMELELRETEFIQVWKAIQANDFLNYPSDTLEEVWRTVLRNQFHDIIPGSSIREVYEDSKKEYEEARAKLQILQKEAADSLAADKKQAWSIVNSSSWNLDGIVKIKTEDEGVWEDEDGEVLLAQKGKDGWLVDVPDVPGTGCKQIYLNTEKADTEPGGGWFEWKGRELVTPFYEVKFNEVGQIESLYDKKAKRQVVAQAETVNVFQVFEDKPLDYDAWDIDLFYQEKKREITNLLDLTLKEAGPLQLVIEANWYYGSSTIHQDIIFYRKRKVIDFKTEVDWHERQQLLKVAFPVRIRATEATYDIQYGNVKRPTHWNTSWDAARFESVAHQWVDFSERNYGVSLLNDCKYGHDIKDHTIRLSLIKSAIAPDIEQDQGRHFFTYSLYPHEKGWVEANTVQEAWKLNQPFRVCCGGKEKNTDKLFVIDNPHVQLDAMKKAEDNDDIVIRLHEYTGGTQEVTIQPVFAYTSWQECDLRERVIDKSPQEGTIELSFTPYEIKTIRLSQS
ncbi:alpha-mannosidase [Terribacillus halophilus]|uniref:alpha-mannosidase n=1 Tax=Terribacillus halophilus TaxID=361279 RepID=UPI003982524E